MSNAGAAARTGAAGSPAGCLLDEETSLRILLLRPDHHAGGAEIAGHCPLATGRRPRFNEETTIEQNNKKAIRLRREAGTVTEAPYIAGLENETAETLEETCRMARDWKPDMTDGATYTPWPLSDLFLGPARRAGGCRESPPGA